MQSTTIKVTGRIPGGMGRAVETFRQPNQGPYRIRCADGFAAAIERDGHTALILAEGAERNEQEVDEIVRILNDSTR